MFGIKPIILGSASPRRAEILSLIDIDYDIVPSTFDEDSIIIDDPILYVRTLAEKKAEFLDCTKINDLTRIRLTADTVVVLDRHILEKPKSQKEAMGFMRRLSGRSHKVITAICILNPVTNQKIIDSQETLVTFKQLSEPEIAEYTSTKEPYDKAGGYGIQGIGACFVTKLEGDYFNVMGLPIQLVVDYLKKMS